MLAGNCSLSRLLALASAGGGTGQYDCIRTTLVFMMWLVLCVCHFFTDPRKCQRDLTALHVLLRSSGLISLPPHFDSLTPKLAPANVTTVLDPVYKPRRDISFKRLVFAG